MNNAEITYEILQKILQQINNNAPDVSELPDFIFDSYKPSMFLFQGNYDWSISTIFEKIMNEYAVKLIRNSPKQIKLLIKKYGSSRIITEAVFSHIIIDPYEAAELTEIAVSSADEYPEITENILTGALFYNCAPVLDCFAGKNKKCNIVCDRSILSINLIRQIYRSSRPDILINMFRGASVDDIKAILEDENFYKKSLYCIPSENDILIFECIYYFLKTVLENICPENISGTIEELFNSFGVLCEMLYEASSLIPVKTDEYWEEKLEFIKTTGIHIHNITFIPWLLAAWYPESNPDLEGFLRPVCEKLEPVLGDELSIFFDEFDGVPRMCLYLCVKSFKKMPELFNVFSHLINRKITLDFTPRRIYDANEISMHYGIGSDEMKVVKQIKNYRWDETEGSRPYMKHFIENYPKLTSDLIKKDIFSDSQLNTLLELSLEQKNYNLLNLIRKYIASKAAD